MRTTTISTRLTWSSLSKTLSAPHLHLKETRRYNGHESVQKMSKWPNGRLEGNATEAAVARDLVLKWSSVNDKS